MQELKAQLSSQPTTSLRPDRPAYLPKGVPTPVLLERSQISGYETNPAATQSLAAMHNPAATHNIAATHNPAAVQIYGKPHNAVATSNVAEMQLSAATLYHILLPIHFQPQANILQICRTLKPGTCQQKIQSR